MLWKYALNALSEQLNELKVGDDGVNPMERFTGETTYITLKNHHIWGCPVYVLDARLQINIAGLPNR